MCPPIFTLDGDEETLTCEYDASVYVKKKNTLRYPQASRSRHTALTIVPECPHCGGQHEYAVTYAYAQRNGYYVREGVWKVELQCKKKKDPEEYLHFYWKCIVKETKIK